MCSQANDSKGILATYCPLGLTKSRKENASRVTDFGCNVPYPGSIHIHNKLSNPDGSIASWNYTNNGISMVSRMTQV